MNLVAWILVVLLTGIVVWLLLALSGASRTIAQLRDADHAGAPGSEDRVTHLSTGLAPASLAPRFEGAGTDGSSVSSAELSGERHLLVFVDPGCAACDELVPGIIGRTDQRHLPRTLLVSRGRPEDHQRSWAVGSRATLVLEPDDEVSEAYAVEVTPTAFVVDEGGVVVASGVVATIGDLEAMVAGTDGVRITPGTEVGP